MRAGAVVVGGANMDLKARSTAPATARTSNPGHTSLAAGGVARNIAENIARLGDPVHLISMVGHDTLGESLLSRTESAGVDVEHVARTDVATGTYTAILDADGELLIGIADMAATAQLSPAHIESAHEALARADVVVLDGNLRRDTFEAAVAGSVGARTIFEPVSVPKATGLSDLLDHRIYAVTPNRDELAALTSRPVATAAEVNSAAATLHQRGIELVWVRLGEQGSVLSTATDVIEIPAVPTKVRDVTGAGDSMLGAFVHVLLSGGDPVAAARFAHAAAALTIASAETVRPDLTPRLVESALAAASPTPSTTSQGIL
jgi:pseudouridine kinase